MSVTSTSSWASVASLYDEKVARTLASLLEAELVPAHVSSDSKLVADAPVWEVHVSVENLERALDLLAKSRPSDTELEYLATGNLSGGGGTERTVSATL
jgi:hypothetical protein